MVSCIENCQLKTNSYDVFKVFSVSLGSNFPSHKIRIVKFVRPVRTRFVFWAQLVRRGSAEIHGEFDYFHAFVLSGEDHSLGVRACFQLVVETKYFG